MSPVPLTWWCGPGDPGVDELDVVQRLLLAQQVFVTAGVTHLQTREILRRHAGQTADQALRITWLTFPLIKKLLMMTGLGHVSIVVAVCVLGGACLRVGGWLDTDKGCCTRSRPASGAGAKPGHPPALAPAAWPGRVCTNA